MKRNIRKQINWSHMISIWIMGIALLFASCAEDEMLIEEQSPNQAVGALPFDDAINPNPSAISCPDNLANDGCDFTSGNGRDFPNQYLMVDLMNNCRTESLPPNCNWSGNITQTRNIEVDLNNCCYPFNSFNARMNNWKALAGSNRPASNYLITQYERIGGFMVTTYGPYRMIIRVTYRKHGICSETATPIKIK